MPLTPENIDKFCGTIITNPDKVQEVNQNDLLDYIESQLDMFCDHVNNNRPRIWEWVVVERIKNSLNFIIVRTLLAGGKSFSELMTVSLEDDDMILDLKEYGRKRIKSREDFDKMVNGILATTVFADAIKAIKGN